MRARIVVKINEGFTLIEVLLVMALIGIIAALTLSTNMDSFRGYSFRNDRDILLNTLQRARSQAMNNICTGTCPNGGVPHGVHLDPNKYTLFQADKLYNDISRDASADEVTVVNGAMTISGLTDVIFVELSGDVTTAGNITLTDISGRTSVISVNGEGQISWTN